MTWGSHCPDCGKADCKWVYGPVCQGSLPQFLAEKEALESRCRELEAALIDQNESTAKAWRQTAKAEAEVARLRTALAFIKHGGRGANSAEQKAYIASAALSADASPAHAPDCTWHKTRLTWQRRCTCGVLAASQENRDGQ